MQKHYIDISKVTNFKDLWHAGWLFADKKNDEIVILVDEADFNANNPVVLRVLYALFGEGILNSDTSGTKPRRDFDLNAVDILDYNGLATELTKLTGIKFSARPKTQADGQ
jgi:hypothetical protein